MAVLQATSITGGLTMHGMAAGFVKLNSEGAVIMDTNTYLTGITSGQVTTALGYTPVQPNGTGASGTWSINVSGNSQYFANNYIGQADANTIWRAGSYTFFNGVNVPGGDFGLISFPTWSSTDSNSRYNIQLGANIGGNLRYRSTNINGAASWATMLSDANYNSYSPTLTGGGASGTWGINITGNAASATNLGADYTADDWFRATADNNPVKFYGNSYQMTWRTDGTSEAYSGIGGYPFVWTYGGSSTGNRRMLMDTSGNLWTNTYGWLHSYFQLASSAINTSNIGSQSVNYASSAGSASSASSVPWSGVSAGVRTNYNLRFQPPSSDYAGFEFNTSTGGGGGYFLIRGGSDNDVYTAEGITLVADAGWLTLAQRTQSNKGVRIMTGASSTSRLQIDSSGNIDVGLGAGTVTLYHGGSARFWTGSDGTRTQGWSYFQNTGQGLHWPGNQWHLMPADGSDFRIHSGNSSATALRMETAGTTRGYVYANSSNEIGFLNNSRNWILRMTAGGDAYVGGYLYVNGAGTSSSIFMQDTDEGQREIHCNSNRIGFLTQAGSWGAWLYDGADWEAGSSVRAPIFYDSNDTGYYLDPNSTSDAALRIRGGTLHGPNPTWGKYLYVGTNGRPGGDASVAVTNGNLHIDCENGYALYLNWYSNNNIYTQGNMAVGSDVASHRLHVHGTGLATSDFRAPIFYDSNDTSFYLDPNGTSELSQITTGTRARWGEPRWWHNRQSETSDQGYWTGTNGWGTSYGNWDNAWRGGFSGWDIWGTGTAHPQGSGYIHAQGIVSGQHYATSDGSSAYGWMMVGAADATANRYWLRGKWASVTSGWVEMITTGNIGSQSVSYASSAGNADTVDGYHATAFPYRSGGSSGYYQVADWMQFNTSAGLYWPSYYNAHIEANTSSSYGSINIRGSKNGWAGINFSDSDNNLMANSNESGFHKGGYGWQFRWENGTLYCHKNSYGGGTSATVWDSVNAARAANSNLMYYQSFTLDANTMDSNSTGFTYSVNAPFTGPIARFSTGGGYDLWLGGSYGGGGNVFYVRTRNGDAGSMNPWRLLITDGNIASQSVSYASSAGHASTASNITDFFINQSLGTGSGPTFAQVYTSGWFRNYGNQGIYNQDYGVHFYAQGSTAWSITGSGGNIELQFRSNHNSTVRGYVYANTSNEIGFLRNDGNWALRCDPSSNVFGHNNLYAYYDVIAYYSDERLKTKTGKIDNALTKIMSLEGFSYVHNDLAVSVGYTDNKKQQIGLSAQEVQKIAPELVTLAAFDVAFDENGNEYSKSGENYLTIKYDRLVPILVEAIKEQQKQIEELKAKLN